MQGLVDRLDGRAGVLLKHFGTGEEIAIRADEVFPTGCIIKVPILMTLLTRVSDGELDWDARLVMTEDRVYGLDQVVDRLRIGSEMDLSELVHLMVSLSDVAAGLWCQDLAGGGHAINAWLADRGYAQTRVNSHTPGRERAFADFGWGQTTPRESVELFISLRERRAVTPAADAYADRVLSSTFYVQDSLYAVPTDVHAIIKTGSTDDSRSEILLISTPDGPVGCAVMTDGLADTSWQFGNDGDRFKQDVAAVAWQAWGSGSRASLQEMWPPRMPGRAGTQAP